MKYFLKLNIVSALYGFMIFIPLELMFNVYRITRITGLNIGTVNLINGVTTLVSLVVGSIVLFLLKKHWMKGRKANYFTVFLWVPYFVLFIYLFVSLFPITYGGDTPNPVTGLLAIGAMIVYPIYILIINIFSVKMTD
jgi:hypothetical protein